MRIIKDLPQHLPDGTANPDWLALRAGKFTGSDFNQYMPIAKKGELSDTAESNLYKKVLESLGYEFETIRSDAMERGNELEPMARQEYIEQTFNDVQEIAFVDWEKLRAGCSPDGVIFANNGNIEKILEIKSPEIKNYLKMASGKIPPLYLTQVQYNLMITGAKSCDFVIYHPDMKLVVREINADADYQAEILTALEKLNTRYDEILEQIKEYKNG
jgi:putative phage-type endonuclease